MCKKILKDRQAEKKRQAQWIAVWQNHGDQDARMRLVESCMGMVYKMVPGVMRWSKLKRDDNVAASRVGILLATEKYDAS